MDALLAQLGRTAAQVALLVAAAPLVTGLIQKGKARLQCRRGASIWQPYRLNDQFATCAGCGAYVRVASGATTATCECGGSVEPATYL